MKKITLIMVFMLIYTPLLYATQLNLGVKTVDKKANVTIKNTTKKQVIDILTQEMLARGYVVKNISEYKAVYSKVENDPKLLIVFGRHASPENWISYDIVDTTEGVQVVLTSEMVGNPGTSREHRFEYSYYEYVVNSWMTILNALKTYFENPK